jgi:hypothetical protein
MGRVLLLLGGVVALAVVAFVLMAPSLGRQAGAEHFANVGVRSASPAPPPVPAPELPPAPPPCDVHALWFGEGNEASAPFEDRRRAAVAAMSAWTPACRWAAHTESCKQGCDELLSDMLIDAARDTDEKRRLLAWRRDRNTESVAAARRLERKLSAFVSYALRIIDSPRMDDYSTGTSVEAVARDIVNGNPCLVRMRADFVKLNELNAEIDASLALLPSGSIGLKSLTFQARSCVDCSNDRSLCRDMKPEFETFRENIAEAEKLVTADAARLRKLTK